MFWTVNPGWFYAALGGFLATVILHTVASRFAPRVPFSWIGMLTAGRVSGVLLLRIRDIIVVLLRSLLIFLILLYPAKPFLYNGKPPAEIWVKDVPSSTIRTIKETWGKFARVRFTPNPEPKGKVALVGAWSEVPSVEYEIWSPSFGWEIKDFNVSPEGIRVSIMNPGKGRWFHIRVEAQGRVVLIDSLYVEEGSNRTYSATLPLSGPVKMEVEGRTLYDYALKSHGRGRVVATGLDREVWEAAISTLGLDVVVGVDTVLSEEGSLNFLTDCERLKEEGLNVAPAVVEFIFRDSGCVFLSGKPILLDRKGQVVGVEYGGKFYFGFHPAATGWAFTPEFLEFVPIFSRSVFKTYTEVGDTVRFPEPVEIRGITRVCCPEEFVPKVAGVYEIYRDGRMVGVVVANLRTSVSIPPAPKALWPYLIYAFLIILALEMAITFMPAIGRGR